jgi:hypothetical protein
MPNQVREIDLLAQIKGLMEILKSDFTVEAGDRGGVVILRRGHMRGIWRCQDHVFTWTPAGYNEPMHRSATVASALAYTEATVIAK